MTDSGKANASLVEALGSALRSGDHGLRTVPALLKRVLSEGAWREFVTQRGEHVRHERFADFVAAKPLKGIGADLDLVRRVVSADDEALTLLSEALRNPVGRNLSRSDSDIIINRDTAGGRGTSKEYALRRLRKDAPELHARVLAGEMSANAAMVRAGFQPPRFTVVARSADKVVETLRKQLPADMFNEVVSKLAS